LLQIIAAIVQGVSSSFPCTWEEALIFRRDHIGTPEQAVRSLVYLKNQVDRVFGFFLIVYFSLSFFMDRCRSRGLVWPLR
jgi:hypothetical protein